jgi:hypothetical protein
LATWNYDAAAFSLHSGYEWVIRGNDIYNTANGIATYAPPNPGFAAVTQFVDIEGNNIHQFGTLNFTEHGIYAQSHGQVIASNYIHDPFTGMQGSGIKTRTDLGMIRTNTMVGPVARGNDEVEIQDDSTWYSLLYFGGAQMNYFTSPYAQDSSFGVTQIAGLLEGSRRRFVVGNIYDIGGAAIHHCAGDHDTGGESDCRGTVYFTNNTVVGAGVVFDTMGSGGQEEKYYEYPSYDVQNNVIDSSAAQIAIARAQTFLGNFGKNLVRTGTVHVTPPVMAGQLSNNAAYGWNNSEPYPAMGWANAARIDLHVTGLSNFLFTTPAPMAASYVPASGSTAINAGAALTGIAAQVPARLQLRPDLGYATRRLIPLTLGALDSGVVTTPPRLQSVQIQNGSPQ